MGSTEMVLKAACEKCRSKEEELYCTACGHTTLCASCGGILARSRDRCLVCAAPITTLIKEYNVQFNASTDKTFYIGRFATSLPLISEKSAENRWSFHTDGLQGQQLTDNMLEKYNGKPWVLKDETGRHQYQGQIEGSQSAISIYYLLMVHGNELHAFCAGSWYNFSKIAQYKQLTLEEAEEKMNKRRTCETRYQQRAMTRATNGPATFGLAMTKLDATDREASMDDDEKGGKDADLNLDDATEKGDDWEHEEIFTDDDEAVDIDNWKIADLAPHFHVPPGIEQDEVAFVRIVKNDAKLHETNNLVLREKK